MTENCVDTTATMTKYQRHYALHRDQKLSKYHNNPIVIAKREERERKKAEKELEKETKLQEKEKIRLEKLQLALATKKSLQKSSETLDAFLN